MVFFATIWALVHLVLGRFPLRGTLETFTGGTEKETTWVTRAQLLQSLTSETRTLLVSGTGIGSTSASSLQDALKASGATKVAGVTAALTDTTWV